MNYFTENFGKLAQTFYEKRISYNTSNIGSVGYEVYLETTSGLQSLGFTQNSYFKYNVPVDSGKYNFVVKSSYSIFKANQSTGLKINVDLGGSAPEDPDDSGEDKDKDNENPSDINMDTLD